MIGSYLELFGYRPHGSAVCGQDRVQVHGKSENTRLVTAQESCKVSCWGAEMHPKVQMAEVTRHENDFQRLRLGWEK